jgi:SWI/SNF-related matrix-associated actin-dependent regulator 1 of chromatin subfamily A
MARRSSSSQRPAALALLVVAAAVAVAASSCARPAAAASARALLQQQQAPPAASPAGGGWGAMFQSLPLKEMLAGGGKAFDSWRTGAKRLAKEKRDGPDADLVGSDLPAAAAAAGAKTPLTNTSVSAVPEAKRLFAYNVTARVAGPDLPSEPKDGKFTLLPAGCALRRAPDLAEVRRAAQDEAAEAAEEAGATASPAPAAAAASDGDNGCTAVKLEANAGSNTFEAQPTGGVASTDALNATSAARDTVLTDFARLRLRYQELSLDDGVPGVPVPIDLTAVLRAADGARLNGTASGAPAAAMRARVWGMWTNGEPAIPLRSGIFTLVSNGAAMPFELMGANYTIRLLGLPVQGSKSRSGRAVAGDDRLFVPTPRDALLGAAALRREMGAEWAKDMRVQSVYVARSSPVKILMLPAAVELVDPSRAMEDAAAQEVVRRAEEARAAKVQAALDAQAAVEKELIDYREALLAAALGGSDGGGGAENATAVAAAAGSNATAPAVVEQEDAAAAAAAAPGASDAAADALLQAAAPKEGQDGSLKRMPLPWRDEEAEASFEAKDAARGAAKQERKEERRAALPRETLPGELFARAQKAVELVAQGQSAADAERAAAEAARAEADGARGEEAEAASGAETYDDDASKR